MLSKSKNWVIAGTLSWLVCGPQVLWAKEPCSDEEIQSPQLSRLVEADLALLQGQSDEGALPEWSKIEKLRNFYKEHAERADKDVTRRYAFPIAGPVRIADVAETGQLDTMLEDLAQLQLVTVPRLQLHNIVDVSSQEEARDCFLVSNLTVVPSRVFDDPIPEEASEPSVHLTLNSRRRALEHVVREVRWLQRIDTEVPGCHFGEESGYWDRQIRSLNLTVGELVPDLDLVAQSIRFWSEVEQRIERLRREDEEWAKRIMEGEQASP